MIELTNKERARIFSKITIDSETGCWNYGGYLSSGYGRIFWRGKRYKAHRFFYEILVGNLPKWENERSLEIDHICKNRACVNPNHLEIVSPKENVLRGDGLTAINSRKKTCIHGHHAYYKKNGRRWCRECRRIFDASEKRKKWRRLRNWK